MAEIRKVSSSNSSSLPEIVAAAQQFVLRTFNEKSGNQLVYHNYQRTAEIVETVGNIGSSSSATTLEVATIAAWFQGLGYLEDFGKYEMRSVDYARTFLNQNNYSEDKTNEVLNAILNARTDGNPMSSADEILSDAIIAFDLVEGFFEKNPLQKLEEELVFDKKISAGEWEQKQLNQLLEAKFYTAQAKVKFEPILAQNILTQKKVAEKAKAKSLQNPGDDQANNLRKYQNLETKIPRSGIQTYFRSNFRSHIHLSMIADNKANIMISVNAIVISLLISVLTYQDLTTTAPEILLPLVTFLVTGMTSLIFAILAIRPKVTTLNNSETPKEDIKKNIVFFGNFVHLELEEFEEAMDAMFRDGELMYGNMTRDLYYLGKVLDKKYRYLTNAYNIFMVGFVATVLIFLFSIFFNL